MHSIAIAILGALFCIGAATQWSFNLFEPGFLWKAYNYYTLSLLDGRLDIPAFAIGKEGTYYNSHAYMYYGFLPVIPRLLLAPFIDLTVVPAAYFSILFFTILGNSVLQFSLGRAVRGSITTSGQSSSYQLVAFYSASLLIWLGSAAFLISQSNTIYHEPYAASLCLLSCYLAIFLKNNFFVNTTPSDREIALLALISGLCVHARMPLALALYITTCLLMVIVLIRQWKAEDGSESLVTFLRGRVLTFLPPLSILFVFGVSILLINYLKYDDALSFMGKNYGFWFFELDSDRRCNVVEKGAFADVFRILVNSYVYLSGDWQSHWSLTRMLSTGHGRVELPAIPIALLWVAPLFCFFVLIYRCAKGIKKPENTMILLLLIAISVGAFFQLKYATITHRYVVELWAPLFMAYLYVFAIIARGAVKNALLSIAFCVLTVTGVSYQQYLAFTSDYYLNDGPVLNPLPSLHYSDEVNEFLDSLTPEKIEKQKADYKARKDELCAQKEN